MSEENIQSWPSLKSWRASLNHHQHGSPEPVICLPSTRKNGALYNPHSAVHAHTFVHADKLLFYTLHLSLARALMISLYSQREAVAAWKSPEKVRPS